jgi:UDP-N-acetylglucosamine:LPS N-acetylglucosamine transferase
MEKKKSTYLLLYLKTGGGHLAPARAISRYIERSYGESIDTILIDGFEKTNKVVKYLVEDGYRNLQSRAKWYYEFLYATNKYIPFFSKINCNIISKYTKDYFREVIKRENPERIVILHFFLIQPIYELKKELRLNIPIITIVTDPFTAHPMWFMKTDQCFVLFSDKLRNRVINKFPPDRVNVFPFILDEKYSEPLPADSIPPIKESLNLPVNKRLLLILGGGDGIPNGRKILRRLLRRKNDYSIAIVCGRNKALYEFAQTLKDETKSEDFFIYGYVDFIYELINSADLILTKCGASSMMEILLLQKVPVVNDYIWEQEKGNIDFIRDNNLGIYEPSVNKLISKINSLIYDDEKLNMFKNNIRRLSLENGTAKVSEFIVDS